MLTSLALIFLVGLIFAAICEKIRLPRIIGMIFTGIILGPYVLNLLDDSILLISGDLRQLALVIILIKAGLSLNLKDLKQVGRPSLLLSFLPASLEIVAYMIFAPIFFDIRLPEAAIIGAVLAAVSPAVVVPRMVTLMEEKYGTEKSIPQMILAGASLDDIFVIVLFTTFLGIEESGTLNLTNLFDVPVSIITGIVFGAIVGILMSKFFEYKHSHGNTIRNSVKVIIVLGVSFLLLAVEDLLENHLAFSGLLSIMSMSCALATKSSAPVRNRLSAKFGKLWLAAEIVLFVLVGAIVDIRYLKDTGLMAIGIILLALVFRCAAVWLCMLGTKLNTKEKVFCMFSYMPKATVQAAIGSVPLAMGLPCGNLVLSISVLAIVITAPLGATLMDTTYKKLLEKN